MTAQPRPDVASFAGPVDLNLLDEREAEEARERYRVEGLPPLPADDAVAAHLVPGEAVVARRGSAELSPAPLAQGRPEVAGPLYLTTRRLLVLAGVPLAIDLARIDEVALAGDRLLVSLRDGTGLALATQRPRLLRVQIAAALIGARLSSGLGQPSPR